MQPPKETQAESKIADNPAGGEQNQTTTETPQGITVAPQNFLETGRYYFVTKAGYFGFIRADFHMTISPDLVTRFGEVSWTGKTDPLTVGALYALNQHSGVHHLADSFCEWLHNKLAAAG